MAGRGKRASQLRRLEEISCRMQGNGRCAVIPVPADVNEADAIEQHMRAHPDDRDCELRIVLTGYLSRGELTANGQA